MSKPLPDELEQKYAKMWHESCGWEIPGGIEPFITSQELIDRLPELKKLYVEACWKVLDMMADDGLIRQSTLRRLHEEENGWPSGQSKIDKGYVDATK